jgi:hypothetical protein
MAQASAALSSSWRPQPRQVVMAGSYPGAGRLVVAPNPHGSTIAAVLVHYSLPYLSDCAGKCPAPGSPGSQSTVAYVTGIDDGLVGPEGRSRHSTPPAYEERVGSPKETYVKDKDTSPPAVLLPDRVTAAFDRLSEAAGNLNSISDQLGKSISAIEEVFQRVNAGVPAWVEVAEDRWDDQVDTLYLGYAKVNNKWGVAVSTEIAYAYKDELETEEWLFGDAPRRLRMQVIDKLPELIDKLTEEANKTAAGLTEKLANAQQVAEALKTAAKARGGAKQSPSQAKAK